MGHVCGVRMCVHTDRCVVREDRERNLDRPSGFLIPVNRFVDDPSHVAELIEISR